MHLQGNLQVVFDALYEMGVIDPVLDKDWQKSFDEREAYEHHLAEAVHVVNQVQSEMHVMMEELRRFDPRTLEYLAMEVAREFAEYHARTNIH